MKMDDRGDRKMKKNLLVFFILPGRERKWWEDTPCWYFPNSDYELNVDRWLCGVHLPSFFNSFLSKFVKSISWDSPFKYWDVVVFGVQATSLERWVPASWVCSTCSRPTPYSTMKWDTARSGRYTTRQKFIQTAASESLPLYFHCLCAWWAS